MTMIQTRLTSFGLVLAAFAVAALSMVSPAHAAIDTSALSTALTDMGTAATPIIASAIAVGVAIFAILWLYRKMRSAVR